MRLGLLAAAVFLGALLASACSASDSPNWRDELVALSQSDFAASMYYSGPLDASTVEATMDAQCGSIDRVLANPAFGDNAALLSQLTVSIELQREVGVPDDLLRRDFAALDAGMRERCPDVHERLAAYLPVATFDGLLNCGPVAVGDDASRMAEACGG